MVAISGDGSYYVGKYVSGTFTFIQSWTTSPYLNLGSTPNTVLVSLQGSSIRAYFNGTLAWSGSDTSIAAGGRLGLLAYSGSSVETIHYFLKRYVEVAVGGFERRPFDPRWINQELSHVVITFTGHTSPA